MPEQEPYRPLQECQDKLGRAKNDRQRREIMRDYYRSERSKQEQAGEGRKYNDNGHGNNRANEAGRLPRNHPDRYSEGPRHDR